MSKRWASEILVDFALIYAFMVGTIFISYSAYRGLFHYGYYYFSLIIFSVYLAMWIFEKKRFLNERRTENRTFL